MVIDGKKIADEALGGLKKEVSEKESKLRLAAILVGDDPEFKKFVELKGKVAENIGVSFEMYQFSENIANDDLIEKVKEISEKSDGALIELPLPKHINTQAVLDAIPVEKDVDVLSTKAQAVFHGPHLEAKLPSGESQLGSLASKWVLPPAVEALKIVLEKYGINPKGKKAAVFGQGILVGEPVSSWLEQQGAEVYRIRSTTEKPEELSRKADIIVSGVGKPDLVRGDMVKSGVVVIDFGYGKKDNKMVGDVDFGSVAPKASLITSVPGGMGPILIAAVLKNLVKLNE